MASKALERRSSPMKIDISISVKLDVTLLIGWPELPLRGETEGVFGSLRTAKAKLYHKNRSFDISARVSKSAVRRGNTNKENKKKPFNRTRSESSSPTIHKTSQRVPPRRSNSSQEQEEDAAGSPHFLDARFDGEGTFWLILLLFCEVLSLLGFTIVSLLKGYALTPTYSKHNVWVAARESSSPYTRGNLQSGGLFSHQFCGFTSVPTGTVVS